MSIYNPFLIKKKCTEHEWPHLEDTASKQSQISEREREHEFIQLLISKRSPQTINGNQNPRRCRLGTQDRMQYFQKRDAVLEL